MSRFTLLLKELGLIAFFAIAAVTNVFSQVAGSNPATSANQDGLQSQGPSLADQLEIADLYRKIDELQSLNQELSGRLTEWKALKPAVQSPPDLSVLSAPVVQFNTAFEQLDKLPPDTVLHSTAEPLLSLLSSASSLNTLVRAPYLNFLRSQPNQFNLNNSPADRICSSCLQQIQLPLNETPSFSPGMDALFKKLPLANVFSMGLPNLTPDIKRSEIQTEIEETKKVMPLRPETVAQAIKDSQRAFDASMTNVEETLGQRIKNNEQQIADLTKQAESHNRGLQGRQSILTWFVILVVPLMVVAVALTIQSLKTCPPTLSNLLIRERTIIELFSVTFLFVAILFLGAGGFVETGVLGTLLGTVAGYVFTRRANQLPGADPDQSDLPDAPLIPSLNAPRTVLQITQFPAKAMFISAFYRQVGATVDISLGSSTSTHVTFPALTLIAGTQYEFWVTSTNAQGTGQPSPKLLVVG